MTAAGPHQCGVSGAILALPGFFFVFVFDKLRAQNFSPTRPNAPFYSKYFVTLFFYMKLTESVTCIHV